MKTLSILFALMAMLSFQAKEFTNTYWIPFEQHSDTLDNSLQLKRQGIKILACRCLLNGKLVNGQIIGKECHIRKNGNSIIEKKFDMLLARNTLKIRLD